jgi:serine/threonine-protein kinase HipA
MKAGKVYLHDKLAGIILQDEDGYCFVYDENYLKLQDAKPVSLTLPLREKPFISRTMIPFFDGLIPEGWLLDITVKNWKLDPRDRMSLLLTVCKECIGAVSIIPVEGELQ